MEHGIQDSRNIMQKKRILNSDWGVAFFTGNSILDRNQDGDAVNKVKRDRNDFYIFMFAFYL